MSVGGSGAVKAPLLADAPGCLNDTVTNIACFQYIDRRAVTQPVVRMNQEVQQQYNRFCSGTIYYVFQALDGPFFRKLRWEEHTTAWTLH